MPKKTTKTNTHLQLAHRVSHSVFSAVASVGLVAASTFAYVAVSSKQPQQPAPHTQVVAVKQVTPLVTPQTIIAPAPVAAPTVNPNPVVATPAPAPVIVTPPTSTVSDLTPAAPPAATPSTTAPPASTSTSAPAAAPLAQATGGYSSTNWSGYLAASASYTSVSGSWNAPTAVGNGVSMSADATWIGIGGVKSGDLIQIGTDNTVTAGGQVSTEAFYEMLPDVSQPVPGLTVTAGDAITASINETSTNQWLMTITDTTTGQTYSNTFTYTSSHSSAEWIQEDPSYSNNHLIPLDTFSMVSFTHAAAVSNGTSLNLSIASATPITMLNRSGKTVSYPSVIGSSGADFTVTRASN